MDPVELTDGTVRLDRPTAGDLDAITAACQDPEIARWTTVPSPYSRADAEAFLTTMVEPGWASGENLVWALRTADLDLAGVIGLHRVRNGSAEVGYWLAPAARGRGLLHRGLHLVLDWALEAPDGPGLEVVEWRAFAGNWPSWRAAWRLGFRFDGVARLGVHHHGRRYDDWLGSLLRGEPREPRAPWPATAVDGPLPPDGPIRAVRATAAPG